MNIPAPTLLAAALAHIEPFRPKGIGLAEPTALCPIGLEDFLTRPFPPREMVCAPWLPVAGLAMLYAPRGVGKTHVALGLAHAVASGGRFLKWHAPKPRRVLVIDGEMPAITLQDRLLAISQGSTLKPPSDDYLRILASDLERNGLPDLSSVDGQQRYDAIIGEADLIIVDNISTLCRSGRENDAESWLPVQSWALPSGGQIVACYSFITVERAGPSVGQAARRMFWTAWYRFGGQKIIPPPREQDLKSTLRSPGALRARTQNPLRRRLPSAAGQ
jgi:hypothetical protein